MAIAIAHYTLATAGHAAHGKSALVKALAGMAPQPRPRPDASGFDPPMAVARLGKFELGIVDLPGHQDLIDQMIRGAAFIHLAILVVAADQGWMPQTEEHLQLLEYLGINRAVLALSKIDLVKDPVPIMNDIRNRLAGTSLADAPIVPTSVLRASTVANLRKIIVEMVGRSPAANDLGKPRLFIDCLRPLPNAGTAVSGALTGGCLMVGQEVLAVPGGARPRIAAAHCCNRQLHTARPGSRVDLDLTGDAALAGGDVLTVAGVESSTSAIDVQLFRSPRSTGPHALSQNQPVQIHCGLAVSGRLHLFDSDEIVPGQKAMARLLLDRPVMALAYDRLVIRDQGQGHDLAGGIVLDADPPHAIAGPNLQRQLILLRFRADSPQLPSNYISSQLARDGVAQRPALLLRCSFSKAQIDWAMARMLTEKSLVAVGDIIADASWWQALGGVIAAAVDVYHRDHPDKAGLPLTELRPLAASSLPPNVEQLSRTVIDAMLDELCAGDFVRSGAVLARRGHQTGLSPGVQAACQELRRRFDENPLDPPPRMDLSRGAALQAIKVLIATGQVIDLGADVVLSAQAYRQAVDAIRQHLHSQGPATVSELASLLSCTRRVVVPLLQKMDRDKITVKEGSRRRLLA